MKRSKAKKEAVLHKFKREHVHPDTGLTPLSDVLNMVLNDPSIPFNTDDARVWKVWDQAVGPAIARNARPAWIRNGLLRVRVSGPIWLQELEFAREAIQDKLNKSLGRKAVTRIEFRLGDPGKRGKL